MWINSGNGFKHYRTIGRQSRQSTASRSAFTDYRRHPCCRISSIRWWKHNGISMSVKRLSTPPDESQKYQFCALDYRPQDRDITSSRIAPVVLLVLRDEKGSLRFLIHPELRAVVQESDWAYLESLLQDFLKRAKLHPEALFKQLCSLGAGPLVTQKVGSSISDHPPLLKLCSHFVQL